MKSFLFIFPLLFIFTGARAADSTKIVGHRLELTARGAYVMPTNIIVRGYNAYDARTASAFGGNLEYGFSFSGSTKYGKYYPYAYQGAGIGAVAFSSDRVMGNPINIYVFQGSRIASLSSRLSLDYEWNFGLSAGWRKISTDGPLNVADVDGLGSRLNAYIDLGIKFNYVLTPRLSITAGINISHYSNGNTDYPNPGINLLSGRLGLIYKLGRIPDGIHYDWTGFSSHCTYDLTVYGAWRKHTFEYSTGEEMEERVIPGHWTVWGLNFNPLWHFNPMVSVGGSLDFQFDGGANLSKHYEPASPPEQPQFYRPPYSNRMMLGLSGRIELKMPVFAVNIGLGHSLYAPGGKDLRGWYQMFTLKTFITRNLYLSTGYRLVRFKTPGNLMLGLGWSFGGK